MPPDQIKLSDALRWLYEELVHIRRIHFIFIVLSILILIITLTRKTNTLYLEMERFYYYAPNFYNDSGLRQIFRENIDSHPPVKVPPEFVFIQNHIPKEKLFYFQAKRVTDVRNRTLDMIRKDFEEGVQVRAIEEIEVKQVEREGYIRWKSQMEQKDYMILPYDTRIQEWPTEKSVGKLQFTLVAGFFYQERRTGDMPPERKWVRLNSYSGGATFKYDNVYIWNKSKLWFSQEFPYLFAHWGNYANKTLENSLEEAKKELAEQFVPIVLPFDVKIEKDYSLVILPLITLMVFVVLVIEVRHVAAYARFCRRKWTCEGCFLCPWIGGRNWWLRWPLLIFTLLVLPGSSVWLLFKKFPIFGYYGSNLLAGLLILAFVILAYLIRAVVPDIAGLSFPSNSQEKNRGKEIENKGKVSGPY